MLQLNFDANAVSARLKGGIAAAVFALSVGASGHALAAQPTEVSLASSAQALAYCQAGTQKGTAYFNGTEAQFTKKCAQATPTKRVAAALLVTGNTVSECKLATPKQAIALCDAGGMGTYDIAYVAGPALTVIGGPGYGCTTNQTTLSIGNAICK